MHFWCIYRLFFVLLCLCEVRYNISDVLNKTQLIQGGFLLWKDLTEKES